MDRKSQGQEASEIARLQARIAELENEKALTEIYFNAPNARPEGIFYFINEAKQRGIEASDLAGTNALILRLQSGETTSSIFYSPEASDAATTTQDELTGPRLIHPNDLLHLRQLGISTKDIQNGCVKVSLEAPQFEPQKLY